MPQIAALPEAQITSQDLLQKVADQAGRIAHLELANTSLQRALGGLYDEVVRLKGEAEAREVALEMQGARRIGKAPRTLDDVAQAPRDVEGVG